MIPGEESKPGKELNPDSMIDIEVGLIKNFGWNLYAIDATDIESLLPFISRIGQSQTGMETSYALPAFCDEVNFL